MFTNASDIYYNDFEQHLHVGVEANFKGGGWGLQIERKDWKVPPFNRLHISRGSVAFFAKGHEGSLFWKRAKRGTMLMLIFIGGIQLERFIFQTEGMMDPVIIPPFLYELNGTYSSIGIELQYQGEGACNFEYHVTMPY